jgi:hypothetical protein
MGRRETLFSKALYAPVTHIILSMEFRLKVACAAWDYTMGESDVIVAVVDTGAYFP